MPKFKVRKNAKHISVTRQQSERGVSMTVYLGVNLPYSETEELEVAKCACIGNSNKVFRITTMTHHC